jgi:hypothetical protein
MQAKLRQQSRPRTIVFGQGEVFDRAEELDPAKTKEASQRVWYAKVITEQTRDTSTRTFDVVTSGLVAAQRRRRDEMGEEREDNAVKE